MFRRLILLMTLAASVPLSAQGKPVPEQMSKIMHLPKYQHASWGLFAKDMATGTTLYDLNGDRLFLPASTTKLFSISALLHAFGDNYRFKTPVYAVGELTEGRLKGNLVLVGQGDLTLGGRQGKGDTIAYTPLDHSIANYVPGATLTPEDPLDGLRSLAKQISSKGIKQVDGDILVDDRLFQPTEKRGMMLSPIIVNENLIDIVVNPTAPGQTAAVTWRPHATGYTVTSEVKTGSKESPLDLQVSADPEGRHIVIKGTLPLGQKDVVRTFSIKDPAHFAKAAFTDMLREAGVIVNTPQGSTIPLPPQSTLQALQPVALLTSPPLSQFGKLVLKVSHNMGANLVPLLLASQKGEKTYDFGMKEIGNFVTNVLKVSDDAFVFTDAAGADDNRLTPLAEVQLLEYLGNLPPEQFHSMYDALPIMGVDGSLQEFGKKLPASGKLRAKTGTGASQNLATGKFFLTTQVLAGYIEGKNGHMIAFMLAVNNATMPTINDVFAIFEDVSQAASVIYDESP